MREKIKALCLSCGKGLDGATAADGGLDLPQDGDISVCAYCGEPGMYVKVGEYLTIRPLTDEEKENFSPIIAGVVAYLRRVGEE